MTTSSEETLMYEVYAYRDAMLEDLVLVPGRNGSRLEFIPRDTSEGRRQLESNRVLAAAEAAEREAKQNDLGPWLRWPNAHE